MQCLRSIQSLRNLYGGMNISSGFVQYLKMIRSKDNENKQ